MDCACFGTTNLRVNCSTRGLGHWRYTVASEGICLGIESNPRDFSSQRVAAKINTDLFYFQGDHLGSSSVVMTQAGTSFYSRQTYFPYGAQRTTEGNTLPTDYTFTGQKSDDSTGLMFYGWWYNTAWFVPARDELQVK